MLWACLASFTISTTFTCKKWSVNVKLPVCEVWLSTLDDEKCCWREPAMQTDKFQRTYWKWLQLSQTAKLNTGWAAGYLVDGQPLWHGKEWHMALKTTFGTRHLSTEIDPKQRQSFLSIVLWSWIYGITNQRNIFEAQIPFFEHRKYFTRLKFHT